MTEVDERLVVDGMASIPPDELDWRFTTSGGPGGQHANRARTRVELRYDIVSSTAPTERQRGVLRRRLGDTVTVVADDERSQRRNRALARRRLAERLGEALRPTRPRVPTRPSRAARQRRLDAKRRTASRKRDRSWRPD